MSEHESPNTLSSRTTPTWEVELLISGGAVFTMFQLLGWLDDAFLGVIPRVSDEWLQLARLVYIYVKSATLILSVTFVLHLILRARWIALVGIYSVYPDGIRWDKVKLNPIQREVEQGLDIPFPERIERADNLATTVFAIGVMFTMLMAAVAAGAIVLSMTAILLASIPGGRLGAQTWLLVLVVALLLPSGVVTLLDHSRGAIWPKERFVRRVVRTLLRFYVRIGFGRVSNPTMALISSQGGDRKTLVLTMGVITLSLLGAGLGAAQISKANLIGNYKMFPDTGTGLPEIDSVHYDDQRDPLRDGATPYIPTLVAKGPYLALVIPYQPRLDEPAMRKICSQTDQLEEQEQGKARLACLASLHPVSLDDVQLVNSKYDLAEDPRADRPALLVMIDIRTLAAGRHELKVGGAPPPKKASGKKTGASDAETRDYVIPFWT